MVSELVKCCSRRVFRFEAVLVVDRRYVIGDFFQGVWLLGTRRKWVYRRSLGGDLCLVWE